MAYPSPVFVRYHRMIMSELILIFIYKKKPEKYVQEFLSRFLGYPITGFTGIFGVEEICVVTLFFILFYIQYLHFPLFSLITINLFLSLFFIQTFFIPVSPRSCLPIPPSDLYHCLDPSHRIDHRSFLLHNFTFTTTSTMCRLLLSSAACSSDEFSQTAEKFKKKSRSTAV